MAEALTNQAHEYLYRKIISCEYLPGQELNEKAASRGDFLWKDPAARSAADAAKRKSYRYLPTQRNAYQSIYRKKRSMISIRQGN